MEDTNIREISQNMFADLFPVTNQNNQTGSKTVSFGGAEIDTDILSSVTDSTTLASTTDTTTVASTTDTTTVSTTDTTTQAVDNQGNVDILGGKTTTKQQTSDSQVKDMVGFFQDRITNGKFVGIKQEVDGKTVDFIPKTPEEMDEVLELQVDYRYNQKIKDVDKKWYESKPPAWQAVARYAEMVDDPSEIIPFLQGVKTIQTVAGLDENEIDQAEQIVRVRLESKGDPEDVIDSQIDTLKTAGKLVDIAKQYKPLIINEEQQNLARQVQYQKQQEQEWLSLVGDIRESAIKSIESPVFGTQKLKREEKEIVYDLIAEPSAQTKGYGIYTAIDQLFQAKNFEKLTKVALLLGKEDSFFTYFGVNVANNTQKNLEKKLRVAAESSSATGNDFDEDGEQKPVMTRNQFNRIPKFGSS
jgi:hypothetical protein